MNAVGSAASNHQTEASPCDYALDAGHQRAHQQALETYTSFVVCSLIGGVRQPLLTTVAGVVYIIARLKWAKGYTTGDPMNRYKKSDGWGFHVRPGLEILPLRTRFCLASLSCPS